jgi:hypothetical protein
MNRLRLLTMATATLLCLWVGPSSDEAIAQTKISKNQLVGTWSYTSVVVERQDGTKVEPWGPKPVGLLILTADGRYSLQLIRSDLPKFASKDRLKGTPEENQAVAQGVLGHFGTYTVNEAEGTYTLNVEVSSFAADNGTKQVRTVTSFSADEFKTINPTPTTPGKAYAAFKRVK